MKIADQADRKEMLQVRNKLAFILSLNRLIVGKHEQIKSFHMTSLKSY